MTDPHKPYQLFGRLFSVSKQRHFILTNMFSEGENSCRNSDFML